MPTIKVQDAELTYGDGDVISFGEGLVGLPHLRRMVLAHQPAVEPFMWLVSLHEPQVSFLVAEPRLLFPDYAPLLPTSALGDLGCGDTEMPLLLSTVLVAPEWSASTINLRAPVCICPRTMHGRQFILADSRYELHEPLPLSVAQ